MIDVSYDFTFDCPHYWDHFWEKNGGMGSGNCDPDSASETLQRYHQILWSKRLPVGMIMDLKIGSGPNYLTWNDFRFGSDSMIVSFRYRKNRALLEQVSNSMSDYKAFVEDYVHRSYTIGGMIIFPKHSGSINQRRGTNQLICDRWDLTLECIRRFYKGEGSPLYSTLLKDQAFFDLFVDFKGYVDYFYLQDCVSSDYSKVNIWLGRGDFTENPLPHSVEQYRSWIGSEMDSLDKRNGRINEYLRSM